MTEREPGFANPTGFARGRTWRLAIKELRETLRDRRTIATLVLMPLLVYPLLGATVQMFLLQNLQSGDGPPICIAIDSKQSAPMFERVFVAGHRILSSQKQDEPSPSSSRPVDRLLRGNTADDQAMEMFTLDEGDSLEDAVLDQRAHIGVRVVTGRAIESERANTESFPDIRYELIYEQYSSSSRSAFEFVTERLRAVNEAWMLQLLGQNGLATGKPAAFSEKVVTSERQQMSLISFVPLVLVLMTITGAVYPAIDLTAGERERGTMEILIAAPIPRMSLLFGKFVAVLTVAMLTAIFNMAAMLFTATSLGLGKLLFGDAGISVLVLLQILLLLFVFAAFFSAVLLGVTSFARSFKEAQAYLIPLMLISLAPGLVSLMPGLTTSPGLAVVPLVNIVLVARDLLSGTIQPGLFAMAIIATLFYGLLALAVAARVFGTDPVLYGSAGTWKDLLRRPAELQAAPSMPAALFCLALLFPSFIVAGGFPAQFNFSMRGLLMLNALLTTLLFFVVPLLFTRFTYTQTSTAFSLSSPSWRSVLGAVLIGTALWVFVYEIELFLLSANRVSLIKELYESIKVGLGDVPLGWKLFCLAVVPAVCEEWFFRGFLLNAFRRNSNTLAAVIASSILFGLFHVLVREKLLVERLLPSTLMGLLLGWVCVRTGSLFPGILLHFIHNGLLVSISAFEQQIQAWGIGISEQQHLPAGLLLGALLPVGIGFLILIWSETCGRGPAHTSAPSAEGA